MNITATKTEKYTRAPAAPAAGAPVLFPLLAVCGRLSMRGKSARKAFPDVLRSCGHPLRHAPGATGRDRTPLAARANARSSPFPPPAVGARRNNTPRCATPSDRKSGTAFYMPRRCCTSVSSVSCERSSMIDRISASSLRMPLRATRVSSSP